MDDTKYFEQALLNAMKLGLSPRTAVGDLTIGELSCLLRDAQKLKEADQQKGKIQ